MKTKLSGIMTLLLAFVVQFTFAQEKTITGVVSDETGSLPGVSVIIEGTTSGTETDFDGNYTINANNGDVLRYSFVGMTTVSRTVGLENIVNVTMVSESNTLDEVVVTAQGIKREKKALGYAVSEVSGEEMEQKPTGDVARVLTGKASGVQITSQSGTSGSATNVVIRGYSSINGSNQALFVVDGVPFSSDTNAQGNFLDGNVGSSRFLDLDPNNIESVNVLKGLAAATLYGSEGRNGVIVITTKSGSTSAVGPKKTEISVTTSYHVNEIASMPDYQNQYGGGFDQSFGWFFSNWGPSFTAEGVDGYLNDPSGIIQDDGTVEHPYGSGAFLNNFLGGDNILNDTYTGERYDWKPYNSVENFFRKGGVSNTSISIRGGSNDGNVTYNVNYGHLDETGFTPGNSVLRNTLSVGGSAKLSNKFRVNSTLNFSRTDFVSPPMAASRGNGTLGMSTFANVFFTPRNVDLMGLPFEIPENGGSIYYRNGNDIINPRWLVKNAQNGQLTNRVYGNASLTYDFSDNLNMTYRAGLDFYNERNTAYSNKNGVNFNAAIFGFLDTWDNNVMVWDHYLALNGSYELSDFIGLNFVVGGTSNSRDYDRQGVASTGQIVFGTLKHFNFENQLPIQSESHRNIVGVFGEASLDFGNFAYLTVSARNDWVSNLPSENNHLLYPSVSASFIPTAAWDGMRSENGLNYLKLRAGFGSSANFPTGYPVSVGVDQSTQNNGGFYGGTGGVVTNSVSNFQANPNLRPELMQELEFGLDARFWRNRIDLSASYFERTTKDLIVNKPLPPTTGYTTTQENIGKVEGNGWEVDFGIYLFKSDSDGFSWNSRMNFTTSTSTVTEQDDDIIIFAGSTAAWLGGNAAIEGEELGVIVGSRIKRDENGNYLVNSSGEYIEEENIILDDGRSITPIIGNPTPDYVMNFINNITFKNFFLNVQVNHTAGGDISSTTVATLLGRGGIVTDRKNTFILPGVQESTGLPNDKQINNSTYYFSNVLFGPKELTVYDASVVRLQEVSFGYSIPANLLQHTPFSAFVLTASGFNMWYDAYNTPDAANFDPNVAGVGVGNGRGFDYLNGPSSKRYGFSVKVSF